LTAEDDGLRYDWAPHSVFVNPPYGREIGKWVKKSYDEAKKGATVVMLIPARTDTKYFYDYCIKAHSIIFFKGRVKFVSEGQELPASAPFPSCVVVFKDMTNNFHSLVTRWVSLDKIRKYGRVWL
jgi:site-specific DNA-methyltransferase (adenine-specific)